MPTAVPKQREKRCTGVSIRVWSVPTAAPYGLIKAKFRLGEERNGPFGGLQARRLITSSLMNSTSPAEFSLRVVQAVKEEFPNFQFYHREGQVKISVEWIRNGEDRLPNEKYNPSIPFVKTWREGQKKTELDELDEESFKAAFDLMRERRYIDQLLIEAI